ncbi:metallophosphoesterase [Anaerorhabdus sp.]|uniref:metallophosphoesterase n=1 Tax=Anaerorhabdus sp. TaxID=1872524 RepID=UPI002FC9E39A
MKKVGTLSDIHVDENDYEEILDVLSKVIIKRKYDYFLIGGDISSDTDTSLKFISELENKIDTELIWVAGNHDYWQENTDLKTMAEVRKKLRQCPSYLNGYKIISDHWAIVGDTGWYDYSFGSTKFSINQFMKKKYMRRTWQDSIRIKKDKSDIEIHDHQIKEIKKSMKSLKEYNLIFMTHMINHPGFKVHKNMKMWDYFNAFLGSESLFNLTLSENVKHIISGHVHYRRQIIERGKNYYCACLGTKDEFKYYGNEDLKWNIENAILEFKLGE